MTLLYIEKIPVAIREPFAKKLKDIATFLGTQPDWLMQVMKAESSLKPNAQNWQGTGPNRHLVAAGLLQFTKGSGIVSKGIVPSIEHILSMNALEQLDLVKWYFTPYKGKLKSYFDVYAVTFFPAMIGKPDNWMLKTDTLSAATIAKQNKAISKGKSAITVADFKAYTVSLVPKTLRDRVFGTIQQAIDEAEDEAGKVADIIKAHPKQAVGISTGIIVLLGFLGWYVLRA